MKGKFKIITTIAAVFVITSVFAAPAFAQLSKAQTWNDVANSLCGIARIMFNILIIVSIIMVLVAAYQYLTAGGEPEKVKSATRTITYAAVAIVVALLAFGFPSIVASVFGDSGFRGCGSTPVSATTPSTPSSPSTPPPSTASTPPSRNTPPLTVPNPFDPNCPLGATNCPLPTLP